MPRAEPGVPGITDWRPLARGGFATVWQARQESLDRPVAVKVDERTLDSEAERRRFLGEARAAGRLSGHPGIVTVHDAGILDNGRPYLVMKLCEGGSLTRWLQPDTRQSPEQIRVVAVNIADALAAAHAQGLLHGDVKPANVLIDGYGRAGLADFGLSAFAEPGSVTAITPAYAAPESLRGEPPTESCDVYQLAATMYALLSGRPPRDRIGFGDSLADLGATGDKLVPPLTGINEELMQVILDGLSPKPEDRPTAAEFRDRLAAVQLVGSTAVSGATIPAPRRRRLGVTILLASVLSLLAILVGGTGVYLYEIDRSVTANIGHGFSLPPDTYTDGDARPLKAAGAANRALDYVLIGLDSGDNGRDEGGPSDAIMVIHLNAARDRAYIISIPRDTPVTLPGHKEKTINYAFARGGAPLVVRSVEKLTGVRVDHAAMIDFEGFVNLTQDLGGVTVRNDRAFTKGPYTFPKGDIELSGAEAFVFVSDHQANSLEDRAKNQRRMLKAILSKGLSADAIADPLSFTKFVGNAAKAISVDDDLTNSELRSTALSLRLKSSDIELLALPTDNKVQLEQFNRALRNDTLADYKKTRADG